MLLLSSIWGWLTSRAAVLALSAAAILAVFVGIRKDGVDAQKEKDLEGVLKNVKESQNVDAQVDNLSNSAVNKQLRNFESNN